MSDKCEVSWVCPSMRYFVGPIEEAILSTVFSNETSVTEKPQAKPTKHDQVLSGEAFWHNKLWSNNFHAAEWRAQGVWGSRLRYMAHCENKAETRLDKGESY